jgi:hypothetical protein
MAKRRFARMVITALGTPIEIRPCVEGVTMQVRDDDPILFYKRDAEDLARALLEACGIVGTPHAQGATSYMIEGDTSG